MKYILLFWLLLVCAVPSYAGITRVNVQAYDTIIAPFGNGRSATMQAWDVSYPSRDQFGQFMIFKNTAGSSLLMVHAKDTNPEYLQRWEIITNDSTAPCVNTEACLRITFHSLSDPTVEQTTYTGTTDWRVPAAVYKTWALQQSWASAGHGKIATGQLAHVLNCATTHYTYYQSNIEATTTAFATLGAKRVGCFMTQYRTDAFDVDYPDYSCSGNANCAAWLQNLKNSVNGFGLPYINSALWDVNHATYSASNMCLDSGGSPTVYSGDLRYVDPLLSSWATTLRTAFNALQATDTSTSEGVYLDVGVAAAPQTCYYGGGPWVANYAAWIAGMKSVLSAFTDKIIMAEGLGEIYIPYVDIAYIYPPNLSTALGIFGYIYGDVPSFHIVGYDGTGTNDAVQGCTRPPYDAHVTFRHSAILFASGFDCDYHLARTWGATDLRRYYYGIRTPAATRTAR